MARGGPRGTPDLRLLRYFVAVADAQHMGRAAERLFISQPALSRQVQQLEALLASRLFDRTPRGVALTDAGRRLLPAAREALAATHRFADLARSIAAEGANVLRLGFVGQAANELTSALLKGFGAAHPDVRVELRQTDMRDLSAGVRAGRTDLGLVRLPIDTDGLRTQRVLTEPRVVVLPDDHPLTRSDSVQVRDLLALPWVRAASDDPVYQRFTLALDRRDGAPPVLGPLVRNIDEYLQAVHAGLGIGLAPASAARFYARPGITYLPVPDADPSTVALAWRDAPGQPTPAARAMLDVARALDVPDEPERAQPS